MAAPVQHAHFPGNPSGKLLGSALVAGIVFAVVEGLLHLLIGAPPPWIVRSRAIREQLSSVPDLPLSLEQTAHLYREDTDCIYSLRPGVQVRARSRIHPSLDFTIRTDDRGLRVPSARTGAGPVVIAIGDSKTFGWGVEGEESYPARLGEWLREPGRGRAAVVNAAVPGHDIVQGRALLEARLLDPSPAAIVCWFTGDNAGKAPLSDRVLLARLASPAHRAIFALTRASWIASWMRTGSLTFGGGWERLGRGPMVERFTEEDFVREMTAIRDLARARRIRLFFLNKPILGDSEGAADGRRWNEVLRSASAKLGVLLLDVDRAFREASRHEDIQKEVAARYAEAWPALEDKVWRGDAESRLFVDSSDHPNAIGHGLVAELVARTLQAGGEETSSGGLRP